ncbi:MAG: nucleoside triphosphate pyrophosphatase [Kiritimatiellia bacterium]|nr:Maf family nucleotide pyrophosphatase [Lentisphaerota bacterium]
MRNRKTILILASASPARAALLRAAGLRFRVVPSAAAEPPPAPGEALRTYLIRLARLKAQVVAARYPQAVVLAADTALCLPPARPPAKTRLQIIGKPGNQPRARRMLRQLAGKEHLLGTGLCIMVGGQARTACDMARVRLRELTPIEIEEYLRRAQPWHCAGAYALQGAGASIVSRIHGDPTTIIGLPLEKTLRLLHSVAYRQMPDPDQ